MPHPQYGDFPVPCLASRFPPAATPPKSLGRGHDSRLHREPGDTPTGPPDDCGPAAGAQGWPSPARRGACNLSGTLTVYNGPSAGPVARRAFCAIDRTRSASGVSGYRFRKAFALAAASSFRWSAARASIRSAADSVARLP